MAVEPHTSVRLHQCLFGYDNGHRLLSTSLKLPDDAAALLLQHSDLVPGLSGNQFDSYWTGLPLSVAKVYALMRTWPAPEMPRPGCVWTHVILIALADMARFPDLGVLNSVLTRPSVSPNYSFYAEPLVIDPTEPSVKTPFSIQNGLSVVRALYAPGASGVVVDQGEPLDAAVFAAWSQQWPRLRRAFSFRTAGPVNEPSLAARFDLRITRDALASSSPARTSSADVRADWEDAAVDDLTALEVTPYRRFLWRYGSDMRRGREKYRFLAQLFLTTRVPAFDARTFDRTLGLVAEALPEPDDGKLLKDDFLSCGLSPYSLLPPVSAVDALRYVVEHPDLKALPPVPEATFMALLDSWPDHARDVLDLAESAANSDKAIFEKILKPLAAAAEPASFIGLSRDHSVVRKRVVMENPALLDSADLGTLPADELLDLLTVLPDSEDLASKVLGRLLCVDNADVAATFTGRFLSETESHVFRALVEEQAYSKQPLPHVWPDAVRQQSPDLAAHILNRVTTTIELGILVTWLGSSVMSGLRASPAIWAETLHRASDNIRDQARQRLLSYLLALALAQPSQGCEPLFEVAFESVHADISSSRLPYDAFDTLSRYLPNLYWWEQWDTCRRLRLAVAQAYMSADLDPRSFRRLTNDPVLFDRLLDAVRDTGTGRQYLKRIIN